MSHQNGIHEEESLLLQEETHESQPSVTSFLGSKAKVAVASISALCLLALITFVSVPGIDSDVYGAMGMTNMQAIHGRSGHRTNPNSNNRNLIYLDRHNVDCGNNPMSRWKGENYHWNFRVYYECSSVNMSPTSKRSAFTGRNHGDSLIYLDRFSMYCGHGEFMTRWHCHNDHWYPNFKYECAKYNVPDGSCSTHHTHYIDAAHKEILYMDRFDVNCPSGKALRGWRGSGGWPHLRIDYTCCDISYHAPTHQPTYVPSPVPISDPTSQPISHPTHAPSFEPTYEPTKAGPLFCPLDVSSDYLGVLKNLKEGCAAVANEDVNWSKFSKSTKAMVICTDEEITADNSKLRHGHLNHISYLMTGKNVDITYKTDDGKTHKFDPHKSSIVHDSNDNIESMTIDGSKAENVPTQCSDI